MGVIATADYYPDPDWQRAARLIIAHANRDPAGYSQHVSEADQLGRAYPLLAHRV